MTEAVRQVDPWQQEVLAVVRSHGPSHLRAAVGILGCMQHAEDICQTAYARALGAREQIREPAHLSGWIKRVVVNESLLVLRRRKVYRRIQTRMENAPPSPADEVDQLADREWVRHALAELDDRVRAVVVMRLMEGRKGQEVADALGLSTSEVSRRLHKGMEQLRQLWHQSLKGCESSALVSGVDSV